MTVQEKITAAQPKSAIADDMAMLRAAVELTRDISVARPDIYWPDMLVSAAAGYAGIAGAIALDGWAAWASGVVAVFALYRALLFIHELTHIHKNALPGFRFAWNLLVGIPMLTPSFMYEGVHTLHHARTRYGTAEDPEYLPLALMKPWSLRSAPPSWYPWEQSFRRCASWFGSGHPRSRSIPISVAARLKAPLHGWCGGRNWAQVFGPWHC